jgi:aminoglycoside phosphotransferase family enzyme
MVKKGLSGLNHITNRTMIKITWEITHTKLIFKKVNKLEITNKNLIKLCRTIRYHQKNKRNSNFKEKKKCQFIRIMMRKNLRLVNMRAPNIMKQNIKHKMCNKIEGRESKNIT